MPPEILDLSQEPGPLCLVGRGLAGAPPGFAELPALLVEKGRVRALGQAALAAGAPRWELPDLWLCPAPLDAHVHLCMRGSPEENLAASWRAGLAAVRDLGQKPTQPTPGQETRPPLVQASGPGLCAPGDGFCWLAHALRGPEAFARATRERAQAGVAVIKVFLTGLLDFDHPGQVLAPLAVSAPELAAVCQEARRWGLPVAVHASGIPAARVAAQCGVTSLEHGFFLDRPTLALLAQAGVSWVPTAATIRGLWEDAARFTPPQLDNLTRIIESQLLALGLAREEGVNLVLGSDAGAVNLPHDRALFREMAMWQEAGLPGEEIFAAATGRAADLLGLAGVVGELALEARAWLLGVPEDPQVNPLGLASPAWRSF
ncbi:MAG: amidohydrolase family protein [Deltaproteobacteria bacterium]|nr:amidohydrolase family protein [Deltaproteobacteria bacterium]